MDNSALMALSLICSILTFYFLFTRFFNAYPPAQSLKSSFRLTPVWGVILSFGLLTACNSPNQADTELSSQKTVTKETSQKADGTQPKTLGLTPEKFVQKANSVLFDNNQSSIYGTPTEDSRKNNNSDTIKSISIPFENQFSAGATLNPNGEIDGMFFLIVPASDKAKLEKTMSGLIAGVSAVVGLPAYDTRAIIAKMISKLHQETDKDAHVDRIIKGKLIRLSHVKKDKSECLMITLLPA